MRKTYSPHSQSLRVDVYQQDRGLMVTPTMGTTPTLPKL